MKSFFKVLSFFLVVVIMTSIVATTNAAASSYSSQARKLYDLKLFKGTSSASYKPGLEAKASLHLILN